MSKIKHVYVRLAVSGLTALLLAAQLVPLSQDVIPLTYALGFKNIEEFKNHYFVNEPYMVHDPSGNLKAAVGDSKLIVKGVDLIYPTILEFNAEDYSFANLDREQIYSFKTLHQQMLTNDYKYFLVNWSPLEDHFAIWFEETADDKVEDYFEPVIHEEHSDGWEWFLYEVK